MASNVMRVLFSKELPLVGVWEAQTPMALIFILLKLAINGCADFIDKNQIQVQLASTSSIYNIVFMRKKYQYARFPTSSRWQPSLYTRLPVIQEIEENINLVNQTQSTVRQQDSGDKQMKFPCEVLLIQTDQLKQVVKTPTGQCISTNTSHFYKSILSQQNVVQPETSADMQKPPNDKNNLTVEAELVQKQSVNGKNDQADKQGNNCEILPGSFTQHKEQEESASDVQVISFQSDEQELVAEEQQPQQSQDIVACFQNPEQSSGCSSDIEIDLESNESDFQAVVADQSEEEEEMDIRVAYRGRQFDYKSSCHSEAAEPQEETSANISVFQ